MSGQNGAALLHGVFFNLLKSSADFVPQGFKPGASLRLEGVVGRNGISFGRNHAGSCILSHAGFLPVSLGVRFLGDHCKITLFIAKHGGAVKADAANPCFHRVAPSFTE